MLNSTFASLFPLILAQDAPGGGAIGGQLLFFLLFFVALYFLLIAPQRRKQKEHQKMIASLESGDEVVTAGGLHGIITNVKQDRFVVRIADNTKVEVSKSFIHAMTKKDGTSSTK